MPLLAPRSLSRPLRPGSLPSQGAIDFAVRMEVGDLGSLPLVEVLKKHRVPGVSVGRMRDSKKANMETS